MADLLLPGVDRPVGFERTSSYPSVQSHSVTQFTELPFASNTAEFDALETGQVDVGHVPFESLRAIPSMKADGYTIANWVHVACAGLVLQYAKKDTAAPILNQLHVRQAFTHLLDMSTMVHQQSQIFLPVPAYRVVAYKSSLKGVTPLDPYLQIYPQYWHVTK